jgi:hypothetical protein
MRSSSINAISQTITYAFNQQTDDGPVYKRTVRNAKLRTGKIWSRNRAEWEQEEEEKPMLYTYK